jgi:tetratricopeptide (TPR) repeat protein
VELLERRRQAAPSPEAERAAARAQGGVLERVGRSEEAVALYRAVLERAPEDHEALARLAEIFRRESRTDELREPLERLLALALAEGAGPGLDAEAIGLELSALVREGGEAEGAEAVVRKVLDRHPTSADALQALSELLLARGDLDEADATLRRRAGLEHDAVTAARMLTERARLRLGKEGGGTAALALLRAATPEALSAEGLVMRADLAERLGDLTDAFLTLARLRAVFADEGDVVSMAEVSGRLVDLALRPGTDPARGLAFFEELLAAQPGDALAAEALFRLYEKLEDERSRNRGWQSLLERALQLSERHRVRIHVALAAAAEQHGDLARAEEQYRGALAVESEPGPRAEALVGHARVLIKQKELEEAEADLDEALALMPEHAPALALLGDLAYRSQSWEQARAVYGRLAALPEGRSLITPELLAYRRAELADMFGDENEAEAAYAEVASLDPRHLEAREALAQIAVYREDWREAARHLEELLKLYPPDAADRLRDARQRLGEIRGELGDFVAARDQLELLLAEDPDRAEALEALANAYQRLDAHAEAAAVFGRLGRLYSDGRRRAEALYRQGEILRQRLGDEHGADDAYLRSSDMDPAFVPTLIRLVHYYWKQGDFQNVAEVGAELLAVASDEERAQDQAGLLVGLASLVERKDVAQAKAALAGSRPPPDVVAARLAEVAARLGERSPLALDRALGVLLDGGDGELLRGLRAALDRGGAGAAAVKERLERRQG